METRQKQNNAIENVNRINETRAVEIMLLSSQIWPQGPEILSSAIEVVGTPCYIYSEELIHKTASDILHLLPQRCRAFFALMANDNPHILQVLQDLGYGLFAGSDHNLRRVLDLRLDESPVVFAPSAFTQESFVLSAQIPELIIFANSVKQFDNLQNCLPGVKSGVRIGVARDCSHLNKDNTKKHYGSVADRIGLQFEDLRTFMTGKNTLAKLVKGVHIYPGTNIGSVECLLSKYTYLFDLTRRFNQISIIDLGGGLPSTFFVPTNDKLWLQWNNGLSELIKNLESDRDDLEIFLELGRAVIANTAVFATSIVDIIPASNSSIIICDSDFSSFPRPWFYETASDDHPVSVLQRASDVEEKKYIIAGCTTFSGDLLHLELELPNPRIGDKLIFWNAGAYCASMSTRFLGAPRPCEVLVSGNKIINISI